MKGIQGNHCLEISYFLRFRLEKYYFLRKKTFLVKICFSPSFYTSGSGDTGPNECGSPQRNDFYHKFQLANFCLECRPYMGMGMATLLRLKKIVCYIWAHYLKFMDLSPLTP